MAAKKPSSSNSSADNRAEREVDEILGRLYQPTRVSGVSKEGQPLLEESHFDVYEFDLNRENKELPLIIAGSEPQIALQASMLRAIDQLLTSRGLGYFDFAEWKEAFENGFNMFTTGSSPELKKLWEKQVWEGVDKASRPLIVEITKPKKENKRSSFKVVQFFPNRKNKSEWRIFSGSYREIATDIEQWWHQKTGGGDSLSSKNSVIPLEGQPLIKLFFEQDSSSEIVGKRAMTGVKYMRLMNFTDNPKIASTLGIELLRVQDIERFAKKINTDFLEVDKSPTEKGFLWRKGRLCCNYRGAIARRQGLEGYAYCRDEQDGVKLFTRMLGLIGLKPEDSQFSFNNNYKSSETYSSAPKEITVLGQKVEAKVKRPLVDVRFRSAVLYLPALGGKPIGLVNSSGVVFDGKRLIL